MPSALQLRRGTTAQNNSFTGAAGELSVDSQLHTLRVHDGTLAGGYALITGTSTVTLSGKTINLSNNTLSGTIAQFNTALSDGDFATLAGTETFTNKTLTSPTIATPTITGSVTLNTVAYTFPSSQGSSNTALTNNGSGALSWALPAAVDGGTY
jgi:hypothetical protein